jgi:hypothetical protein
MNKSQMKTNNEESKPEDTTWTAAQFQAWFEKLCRAEGAFATWLDTRPKPENSGKEK